MICLDGSMICHPHIAVLAVMVCFLLFIALHWWGIKIKKCGGTVSWIDKLEVPSKYR
jgi:hypothetical protein